MSKLSRTPRLSPYMEIALTVAVLAFVAYVIAGGFNRMVEDVADATLHSLNH